MAAQHTILLLQPSDIGTRTWADYPTIAQAASGIVVMFEAHLKTLYPGNQQIQYAITDLYNFMDSFTDLSCLSLENLKYKPHDRDWLKGKVFHVLKSQVAM